MLKDSKHDLWSYLYTKGPDIPCPGSKIKNVYRCNTPAITGRACSSKVASLPNGSPADPAAGGGSFTLIKGEKIMVQFYFVLCFF